jgi:signal transduction histidine kinase
MENSIRAEASVISISIAEDVKKDTLEIVVEDNGPGLDVPAEVATSPFFTTKNGKRVGLGLSLFRAAAERAGGRITLDRSGLGRLTVKAIMQLSHVDRSPMGDIASTLSSIVCTNPALDLWCRFRVGDRECSMRVSDIAKELPAGERWGLAVARRVSERVKSALSEIGVTE